MFFSYQKNIFFIFLIKNKAKMRIRSAQIKRRATREEVGHPSPALKTNMEICALKKIPKKIMLILTTKPLIRCSHLFEKKCHNRGKNRAHLLEENCFQEIVKNKAYLFNEKGAFNRE